MGNRVKERLRAGGPAVGYWLSLPSPAVAELMASFGMDWLLIDTEHGCADHERVEDMVRATRGTPVVPLVRVAANDPALIKKGLDRGAYGVLVPLVSTAAEAAAAVAAARFPPEGNRGIAGTRASRFGMDLSTYVESWNRDVLVIIQIETRAAVENVEAIAAGYMAAGPDSTLAKIDEGFRFVAAGTDARLLAGAVEGACRRIREGLAARGGGPTAPDERGSGG